MRAIAPEGAMYLSVHFDLEGRPGFPDEDAVCAYLLEAGSAIIPFSAFGDHHKPRLGAVLGGRRQPRRPRFLSAAARGRPEKGRSLSETPAPYDARRLGTFGGVFTPSILTILGVIMYLRFGWVVGSVGLGAALLVVFVSHVISLATGLSVSSIATNRTVGAGGAYFMISRSLGAPAGGAVGIPLFFAQALSVTFYIVGFTESLDYIIQAAYGGNPPIWLDVRIIGTLTLWMLTIIAMKSAEAAIKAQYVVMAAIVLSLISFFLGSGSSPPKEIVWFREDGESFAVVFAVFFPAVTGIMAGVSMSGDLKDARKSLPKGTLYAVLVGFIIYMVFPIWLAMNGDLQSLATNNQYVFEMSMVPALIYVGVWGATLSSAVGSIMAAPRTLQALSMDGLGPKFFAKGHGPANEPRNGLVFTFLLAEAGIMVGSLDLIAPVLTMFFLATYGITNLACALEKWAASPSFRPTFVVPWLISALGAGACFYVMSIIDLPAMIAATVICLGIYFYIQRRNLQTAFGDGRHGIWAALVRTSLRHLHRSEFHPLNWRPNLVIFGGPANRRQYLLDLGSSLVQERGLVSYMQMLKGEVSELAPQRRVHQDKLEALTPDYPNVFFRVDIVPDVYQGMVTVTQSYGIGNLEANTVMLGWPKKADRMPEYFEMLQQLHDLQNSLLLVRNNPDRGLGRRKQIHVWWGGLQANGAKMLLVAYLIASDQAWRGAEISVMTVVDDDEHGERAVSGLTALCESARIVATPVVLKRDGRAIADIMTEQSGSADLTVLGLRLPDNAEDGPALFAYYNTLLEKLPTSVLVHSAADFDGSPVLFDE